MNYSNSYKNEDRHKKMAGFGKRLKQAMHHSGVKQVTLADSLGIEQPEISFFLNNKSFPRPALCMKMAFILNVKFDWLKFGIGEAWIKVDKYPFNDMQKTFADRLTFLSWTRDKSPIVIGDAIGTSYNAVEGWMLGRRYPMEKNRVKLCEYFNVTDEWLFGNMMDSEKSRLSYEKSSIEQLKEIHNQFLNR